MHLRFRNGIEMMEVRIKIISKKVSESSLRIWM